MEILPSESQTQQNQKPKRKYWKFLIGFFAVIIGVFILINAGFWLWQKYDLWQGQKRVQQTVEALKKFEEEDYKKAMADTYGGKTPQETLQMYIDAVEKGDYELASKYFIGDKQEEWKNNLIEINKIGKINIFINAMKKSLNSIGEYSEDKNTYSNHNPLVSFKKYPSGIWKIIKI